MDAIIFYEISILLFVNKNSKKKRKIKIWKENFDFTSYLLVKNLLYTRKKERKKWNFNFQVFHLILMTYFSNENNFNFSLKFPKKKWCYRLHLDSLLGVFVEEWSQIKQSIEEKKKTDEIYFK